MCSKPKWMVAVAVKTTLKLLVDFSKQRIIFIWKMFCILLDMSVIGGYGNVDSEIVVAHKRISILITIYLLLLLEYIHQVTNNESK